MSDALIMLRRAIVWRLGGSLLTVLLAAIAVGAAIVGPLYVQAGGDSLMRSAVAGGTEGEAGLTLAPVPGQTSSVAALLAEQHRLLGRRGLAPLYRAPIATVDSGIRLTGPQAAPYASQLLARTGICRVLRLVSGTCELGPDDALLSTRSAAKLGRSTGSVITVVPTGTSRRLRIRIVGLYRAPNLDLGTWFGQGMSYFPFGYSTGPPARIPQIDAMIVSRPTALAVPPADAPFITLQTPLRAGVIGQGDGDRVRRSLLAAQSQAELASDTFSTFLPTLISGADHQRHLLATIVAVAAVQLALLAIWVLTSVLLRSAELRRGELRVARLRGFPARSMFVAGAAEPAILCAAGGVLGAVGGWAAIVLLARIRLYPGTTVSVDGWVLVCLLAAVLTIACVLGASVLRLLRGSGLGPSAQTGPPGRFAVAADVTILVLAMAGLLAAATSGALAAHGNPIAAAAPALVALATSVIAIRLVGAACRRMIGVTRDSRYVAGFLAATQVGRRPGSLRESRSLIIALCLACFAVSAWAVARRNQATSATFAIGAPTVVDVSAGEGQLQAAVDRTDPGGRWAMAAMQIVASDSSVLAVQTSRLAAVASWPAGVSDAGLAQVSRALTPPTPAQVNLGSGLIRLQIDAAATGVRPAALANLQLSAWVFNSTGGTTIVPLGRLRSGTRTYEGALGLPCPGGCRLVGLGLVPGSAPVAKSESVTLVLTRLGQQGSAGSGRSNADLSADDWRSGAAGASVQDAAGGVAFRITSVALLAAEDATAGITPAPVQVADVPALIPAVAGATASDAATISNGTAEISSAGIDGNPVTLRPVLTATSLPEIGNDGEMVDLTLLERAQSQPTLAEATAQVWIGPRAPADAVAQLRRAGLQVLSVARASGSLRRARYSGPALAYDFMLLATLLALVTVAVSSFGLLAANRRGRAVELAALEVVGVRRSLLRRALLIETGILAVTALFGAAAGAIGAAIAIPALPQLGTASAPLSFALPAGWIILVALGVVLVILITGTIASRGIMARVTPTSLREAAHAAE